MVSFHVLRPRRTATDMFMVEAPMRDSLQSEIDEVFGIIQSSIAQFKRFYHYLCVYVILRARLSYQSC